MSSLFEIDTTASMTREQAAAQLRKIADQLERHNELEFTREGLRYTVDVADQVTVEIELEIGADGNELEIEITW
ncbi:MAG: amphi-Trp domain-containing protein [Ilumatobacter sp.]|jgi:amphi-Trp domain-containing protein|uniref:amphi-Trp domain-containing protein n=1 Tax=Ilumatobacter sp. TaxID=1967498 RepID=UPI00391D47E3